MSRRPVLTAAIAARMQAVIDEHCLTPAELADELHVALNTLYLFAKQYGWQFQRRKRPLPLEVTRAIHACFFEPPPPSEPRVLGAVPQPAPSEPMEFGSAYRRS
jgi:hypothetical protein